MILYIELLKNYSYIVVNLTPHRSSIIFRPIFPLSKYWYSNGLRLFHHLSWPSEVSIIASLDFIHRYGAGDLRFLTRMKMSIASARKAKEPRTMPTIAPANNLVWWESGGL
jgi:hypothetical protein